MLRPLYTTRRRAERVRCRNYEERMSRGAVAGPSLQHAWISPAPRMVREPAPASSAVWIGFVARRCRTGCSASAAADGAWILLEGDEAGSCWESWRCAGGYCCRWSVCRRKWYSGPMPGRRVKGGREDATLTRTKVSDASNGHVGTHSGSEQDVRDVRNSQRGNLGLSPPLPIPSQLCHCRSPPPQHQTCILPCCSSDAHLCLNTSSPPHDPPVVPVRRHLQRTASHHTPPSSSTALLDLFAPPGSCPWGHVRRCSVLCLVATQAPSKSSTNVPHRQLLPLRSVGSSRRPTDPISLGCSLALGFHLPRVAASLVVSGLKGIHSHSPVHLYPRPRFLQYLLENPLSSSSIPLISPSLLDWLSVAAVDISAAPCDTVHDVAQQLL